MILPVHDERDDRTVRVLAELVGPERAGLAYTHFVGAEVRLSSTVETLGSPNGYVAFMAAANMLTRFVGSVRLAVIGRCPPALGAMLETDLERLRRIDTRQGKVLALGFAPGESPDIALHIGNSEQDLGPAAGLRVQVSFDGWSLSVGSGVRACAPVRPSCVPFGAIAGACFGVAEVFKHVLTRVAPDVQARRTLTSRLVEAYSYSTWTADRVPAPPSAWDARAWEDELDVAALLQVGAGAVGNASLYVLSSARSLHGVVTVLDEKLVDQKNLNRCLLFLEEDVGQAKVDVVRDKATRAGLIVTAKREAFAPQPDAGSSIVLSTVDNNAVRHLMQESLPRFLVQGSTSGTSVAVSVHSAVDGLSCLVCRHPDPTGGLPRIRALTVAETAARLGVDERVVASGEFEDGQVITDELIARVRIRDAQAAVFLEAARDSGKDLCGTLGEFRRQYGLLEAPQEPSVPFVSVFAGLQAAAEVVKLRLRDRGIDAPVLQNVLEIDLARDYTRHARLSYDQERLSDCPLCVQRESQVRRLYREKWGPWPQPMSRR